MPGPVVLLAFDANGVLRQLQCDDSIALAVSLYANDAAAGDVSVAANANGHLFSAVPALTALADGLTQCMMLENEGGTDKEWLTGAMNLLFNGASWDRARANQEITVLASAARTAQTDSPDQVNYNGQALILFVNVTVDDATADITPVIQAKDSVSSAYHTIWTAAAAISAVGTFMYLFVPGGAAGSYTEAVNLRIPRTWRLRVTVGDADSCTYSVGAVLLN